VTAARDDHGRRRRGFAWVAAAYVVGLAVAVLVAWLLRHHHPLLVVAGADLAGTIAVFAFSVALDNSSVYDPYWSVAPIPIVLYYAQAPAAVGVDPVRRWVVTALVTLWGIRLTWNWARGWTGLGHEDWRYRDIRARTGRAYWPASFAVIHLLPTVLVYLGCLALYAALAVGTRPFGAVDVLATAVTLGAIALEATADRQLRRFVLSDPSPGTTLRTGVWAWSRHPNYFGEVSFWWGLALFALAAAPEWTWAWLGPAAMMLLFVFVSVPLIEKRMAARRTAWADYRRRAPALVPRWPRKDG
jgi:steroid 5-alpha reductase family enzyme